MNEVALDPIQKTYKDFIKEVFMDPIRTAVVVDDEYPTLEEFLKLSDGQALTVQAKRDNKERVKKIINFCRNQKPKPWLIDVHDGTSPSDDAEAAMVTHFDHTDLLILDYHLNELQGSERSIEILRKLGTNGHFNLVAIYTNGQIDKTFDEVVLSLLSPSQRFKLHPSRSSAIASKISKWEEDRSDIFGVLKASLDDGAYFKVMEREKLSWQRWSEWKELSTFNELTKDISPALSLSADDVLIYLMHLRQEAHLRSMSSQPLGAVTYSKSAHVNWIRTDSLFITVIPKSEDADTIPDKLLAALVAWDPVPHRLILSKMRTELAMLGGHAETDAVSNHHLQAAWLRDLLVEDKQQRRTNVRLDAIRYWESLGGVVRPGVLSFSDQLAEFLTSEGSDGVLKRFSKDTALPQHDVEMHSQINCYVCSKPVEGHHLATGHIFQIGGSEYWLCLSPACDLEPDRKAGWKKRLGDWMPLKGVRLHPVTNEFALKDSTAGNHVFLKLNGEVKAFGFRQLEAEAAPLVAGINLSKSDRDPTLGWEQLFAKNHGHFDANNEFSVAAIVEDKGVLTIKDKKAKVVAQLRYEYALNLLQKLGVHLSRVGLDFRNYE